MTTGHWPVMVASLVANSSATMHIPPKLLLRLNGCHFIEVTSTLKTFVKNLCFLPKNFPEKNVFIQQEMPLFFCSVFTGGINWAVLTENISITGSAGLTIRPDPTMTSTSMGFQCRRSWKKHPRGASHDFSFTKTYQLVSGTSIQIILAETCTRPDGERSIEGAV